MCMGVFLSKIPEGTFLERVMKVGDAFLNPDSLSTREGRCTWRGVDDGVYVGDER